MKHRASFAWKRLRRLEIAIDRTLGSCLPHATVRLIGILKAILPVRLSVQSGGIGQPPTLPMGFGNSSLVQFVCSASTRACMHDAVALQRAMCRGGQASERAGVESGPEGLREVLIHLSI